MTMLLDVASVALVVGGLGFFAAGTLALLRFPDATSRVHALTKADTLGLGFVVLGLVLQARSPATVAALLLTWPLVAGSSAVSGHLLGGVALREEERS